MSSSSGESQFRTSFVSDVAALLGIPAARVVYYSVAPGSVIVTFGLLPLPPEERGPDPATLLAQLQAATDPAAAGGATLLGGYPVAAAPTASVLSQRGYSVIRGVGAEPSDGTDLCRGIACGSNGALSVI